MTKEFQLRVDPRTAADNEHVAAFVARQENFDRGRIKLLQILKRSIDARQRRVMVNLTVRCFIDELPDNINRYEPYRYGDVSNAQTVVVVGAGPGGLFAALRLIELGLRPVVLERGKNVDDRRRDLARISRENIVDENSNYSFGEGGAGAYSDGKLYTRSKKRGSVDRILQIFNQFGASENILIDAHPHIGSDKLPAVIKAMRQQILKSGGDVRFSTRVTGLKMDGMSVVGVVCEDGSEFDGPVILATGHSARDVYRMLDGLNIEIEAKGIAVGVRLEHPQKLIDQIQYHSSEGRGEWLPAAEYSFVTQVDGRGVYSFCMCPGGTVVAAASEKEGVIVNGMSSLARDGENANSALLVGIEPKDFPSEHPLAGIYYQRQIENTAFKLAGSDYRAPAQLVGDFLKGEKSTVLGNVNPTCPTGVTLTNLDECLPEKVSATMKSAIIEMDKKLNGFNLYDAVLTAPETRSSSSVRILRDDIMQCNIRGVYPCGEGAGYAGGIISAAVDGIKCAEKIIENSISE